MTSKDWSDVFGAFLLAGIFSFFILCWLMIPFIVIWALNVLSGSNLPYDGIHWLAVFILLFVIRNVTSSDKS